MSHAILLALAPVFFVMALGYGAGRLRTVDNHQVDGLNALVMDFALPASLFVATASASRSQTFAQAPLFAILGVVMLLLYLAWYFSVRAFSKVSKADASLQALTIAFPNLAGVSAENLTAIELRVISNLLQAQASDQERDELSRLRNDQAFELGIVPPVVPGN